MLAIISVTNLNDLQTTIFLFSILNNVLKERLAVLATVKNIARTGIGLDHLATVATTTLFLVQEHVVPRDYELERRPVRPGPDRGRLGLHHVLRQHAVHVRRQQPQDQLQPGRGQLRQGRRRGRHLVRCALLRLLLIHAVHLRQYLLVSKK